MIGKITAFSGTHGTGKTTAAHRAVADLKIAHPDKTIKVLCDLEVECPYPINRNTTAEAQAWLFSNQITRELSALATFDMVVTDRTIVDVIAYTMAAGLDNLAGGMLSFAENYVSIYQEVFFKQIALNDFHYPDGIRETHDKDFRNQIEENLNWLYAHLFQETESRQLVYA